MPEYTVVWKKEYKVDEPDELAAIDEAEKRLNADMAQQFFNAGEFFEVTAQKEPVKEIRLTEEGIREFLHEYFVAQYTSRWQVSTSSANRAADQGFHGLPGE